MNSAAIYAGTFDPLTLGHMDVAERAARIFGSLIVAVAARPRKSTLFTAEERVDMVRASVADLQGVTVDAFNGLLVDYAHEKGAQTLVRGIRAFSDFENEFQMALTNRKLAPDIETVFLMPKEDYSYVSSSAVREVAELGGSIESFVPPPVQAAMKKRLGG